MTKDEVASLLETVERSATAVAALTGIKKHYMDAGWSERGAEFMVHAMLMKDNGGASDRP